MFDEEELEGVIAHELACVKHRDILISSIAATIVSAVMMSRFAVFFGSSHAGRHENSIALLAAIIPAPIVAMLIQVAI